MKKWGFILFFTICFCFIVWYLFYHSYNDVIVYVGYDDTKHHEIISETQYIPDLSHQYSFVVCRDRRGLMPCETIKGVQHGFQKWYKDGVVEYEYIYDYGNLIQSTRYYNNGLKQQESFYKNRVLLKENFYNQDAMNTINLTISYKNNEKIKKYYKNNRVYKEERYFNNILLGRKLYNDDGLLQQFEEYGSGENLQQFETFGDFFNDFDPFEPNFMPKTPDNNDRRQENNTNDNNNSDTWI